MKKFSKFLGAAAAACVLFGAAAQAKVINKFAADWDFSRDAVVIDVRTPAEWATGVVPGAHKISVIKADGSFNERFFDEVAAVAAANGVGGAAGSAGGSAAVGGAGKPLVLICRSGARSSRAALYLEQRGFTGTIINLSGGMMSVPASVPLEK